MRAKLLIVFVCLTVLNGCCYNPHAFKNSCQKDYWNDSDFDIFGRKNCVGDIGRWVDQNNGRTGYFCTSPKCKTYDKITCKDTCRGN